VADRRPVRRTRAGDFEVRLEEADRRLLLSLVSGLRAALGGDPRDRPELRRLFPPAYAGADDEEAEAEYQALMHDELLASRRASLDVLEATVGQRRVDEEQLLAWMAALNDVRLVLGTRLDVSEDDDQVVDPDAPEALAQEVYAYVGFLLEAVVDALSRSSEP
jgi:hypothetical protein